MAADDNSEVSPGLSKPPLSPSPSPLTGNGNLKRSAAKSLYSANRSGLQLRRSPRLIDAGEESNVEDSEGMNCSKSNGSVGNAHPMRKKIIDNTRKGKGTGMQCFFIGDPVSDDEARLRWPWRYKKNDSQSDEFNSKPNDLGADDDEDELVLNVKCHYTQAKIEKCIFNLADCAYVKGEEGGKNYVGRILEFFKAVDDEDYFRVQWFFRPEDTVIKDGTSHHKKRLFYSSLGNDNMLDCIVSKVKVIQIAPRVNMKSKPIPPCDYYYDMNYSVNYSTFSTMIPNADADSTNPASPLMKTVHTNSTNGDSEEFYSHRPYESELSLLDMYSGCGGMSMGLCLGAKISGVALVTKWAVDVDKSACESLKLNHPETQIRNEPAEDFLDLLKEWDKLCKKYAVRDVERNAKVLRTTNKDVYSKENKIPTGEYEVSSLLDICYGDPTEIGKRGLKFQVRWVGYGPSEDTWEPIEVLSKCQDRIRDFVLKGVKAKILPRPGDVDVICGGPPCQGISGYNRFRNVDSPLDDERNKQIVVFMDIINFLRPKYVLMENVVDILRFAKGCLGRYALSRLIQMNYQARLGIMAAGCYGLPQFRLRVFLWGAHPYEKLPPFPLPTHDVVVRYGAPSEFERNIVAYDEGQSRNLEKAAVLRDAISDLPPVTNHEVRNQMSYRRAPETEFQKYIRASKSEMMVLSSSGTTLKEKRVLYDHRPLSLYEDDYLRVCRIPHKKGANFRDLPGIVVGGDNVVRRTEGECLMPSGKAWVPDYAINLKDGKSLRPFARLWWNETVPTLLCRPDPHITAILHPDQDRVLTVRECARLQGFHDYFQFCGDVKERYCQIGNAVAVSVGRALGYALGRAVLKLTDEEPLITLPPNFSYSTTAELNNTQ